MKPAYLDTVIIFTSQHQMLADFYQAALDLPDPEKYLHQARAALADGGMLGMIVPTTNQVAGILRNLSLHNFELIDVCEIMLRFYKPVPERLRPVDRMVAHTGYLIFTRAIVPLET